MAAAHTRGQGLAPLPRRLRAARCRSRRAVRSRSFAASIRAGADACAHSLLAQAIGDPPRHNHPRRAPHTDFRILNRGLVCLTQPPPGAFQQVSAIRLVGASPNKVHLTMCHVRIDGPPGWPHRFVALRPDLSRTGAAPSSLLCAFTCNSPAASTPPPDRAHYATSKFRCARRRPRWRPHAGPLP